MYEECQMQLSVVVPCYNEEGVLHELHGRVTKTCADLGLSSYEVVLVNDGSEDSTWAMISELARQEPRVVGVNLSRNHGHQLALSAGLSVCKGERVLVLDADLQDPPELLGEMMKLMDQGADVVYGKRRARLAEPFLKKWCAWLFYRLLNAVAERPPPLDTGDFRLISRRVVDAVIRMPERHRFIRGMVSWVGFKQVPLLYDRDPRFAGESKYPFLTLLALAADGVTSSSTRPLTFPVWLGLGSGLAGLLLLGCALVWGSGPRPVPVWAAVLAAVLLVGGIQFIVLAVMGVYLGRLCEQSRGRPLFVISDIVGRDESDQD